MTEGFFLVIANQSDSAASEFVAAAGPEVRLMTPADLSQPGWRLRLSDIADSRAVIGGEPFAATGIKCVLTRLPGVVESDLSHIVASDRAYVAAEMNAFLLAWLTSLECPVVNRPTSQCLSGPMLWREQWVVIANSLAIPAKPVVRRESRTTTAESFDDDLCAATTVTVVGRTHVGAADSVLVKRSHTLAEAVGADMLAAQFDGSGPDANFVAANLWLDLRDRRIATAVIELMRERATPIGVGRNDHDLALGHSAG